MHNSTARPLLTAHARVWQNSVPTAARSRIHQRYHQTEISTLSTVYSLLLLHHLHPASLQIRRGRHYSAVHTQISPQLVEIHVRLSSCHWLRLSWSGFIRPSSVSNSFLSPIWPKSCHHRSHIQDHSSGNDDLRSVQLAGLPVCCNRMSKRNDHLQFKVSHQQICRWRRTW